MISAYTRDFYLDEAETAVFWALPSVAELVEGELNRFSPALYAKVPRLRDYEITELSHALLTEFTCLCIPFVVEILPEAFKLESFGTVVSSPEMKVVSGPFMGQCAELYVHERNVSK